MAPTSSLATVPPVVAGCLAAAAVALAAGCGDNRQGVTEDAAGSACTPATPPRAPHPGVYADPLAIELPGACMEGGLRELPGRWYVNAPGELFSFSYPRFEGSCEGGFRRANWYPEDSDPQGGTFETWSDGTRFYTRQYATFSGPNGTYEYADVFAACMQADGRLATVQIQFDTDRGEYRVEGNGERFELKDGPSVGLSKVGELGGIHAYNLAQDGTWLYVVGPQGFDVVDVADPAHPVRVGHVDGRFNDVKFVRTATKVIAYAAPLLEEGTAIIDVTLPNAPARIGTLAAYSHSVFVTPSTTPPRMYLANYSESVPVYDITNPSIPVLAASVPIAGTGPAAGIHDIHVDGTRIYADKTIDGVVAVDVASGFATPTELGRVQTSYSHATWAGTAGGRKIAIHGDEGMTPADGGAFLRVLDADETSPTFMHEIGRYQSRRQVGIHNMVLVGDRAYIAYYQDGIRVLDLSDPTQPREVAHYNTFDTTTAPGDSFEGAIGLVVDGATIYVADVLRGVIVLDID